MVKERKAQTGATNLSARSEILSTKKDTVPVAFTRSWTHKLISPDVYQPKDTDHSNDRKIENTATWLPLAIHRRDFNSTTSTSYSDPRSVPVKVRKIRTTKEIEDDDARAAKQRESVEALSKLARKCYGTTGAMLKSFNKKSGDSVNIDEFAGYLKRNKLDEYISENDRKNIFESVDPKHDGNISVTALLKRTEEQEFHESEHKTNMLQIRDFLSDHVARNREEENSRKKSPLQRKPVDPSLENIIKKKAIANEADLMKKAIGTKTFDLDISPDELQSVITAMYEKFPQDQGQRQYARFLKLSNLNLDTIPFYDMRKEKLDNLKHRAATIEQTLHSDEFQNKYKELSERRWRGSLTCSGSSGALLNTQTSSFSGSKLAPTLSNSVSLPNLSKSPAKTLPRLQKKPPKNLLTHSSPGVDYDQHNDGMQSIVSRSASSLMDQSSNRLDNDASLASDSDSPSKNLRIRKVKEELFESANAEAKPSDFYTQVVDSSASMGRLKDPTKVMRIEKIDPLAYSPQGRRTLHKGPTDWSRVGVGGERGPEDVGYGNSEDTRFMTTNSEFFAPLVYEPSRPVMRHGVSEVEAAVMKRNHHRKERYERTAANMDATKTRLEFEIMEKSMRSMRNQHSKVIDSIRYETAMLLNDLQCYKKQPLQRMNRKPNLNLSDKMWGGHQASQTVVLVPENRDFNTTYNSSFQSSALLTK